FNIIKDKFKNNKYFDNMITSYTDIHTFLYRTKTENYDNVLDLISIPEYKGKMNRLYNDLINSDEYYKYIIDKSIFTDMKNLIDAYILTNTIDITVICKNDIEVKYLNDLNIKVKTIKYRDKLNLKYYDSIYIKNYKEIQDFYNLIGKSIYIANYRNNLNESNQPNEDVVGILGKSNIIYLIDIMNTIK
ncbi:MAG: hypothetical protein ACRCXT_21120, partial [Paraclostridium sp.]